MQIIEDDETLFISNEIFAGKEEIFMIRAGALNKKKTSESFCSNNLCEDFSKQVLKAVNFLKTDRTVNIDAFRSKLQFKGILKKIF
jgi:hypothetical protein